MNTNAEIHPDSCHVKRCDATNTDILTKDIHHTVRLFLCSNGNIQIKAGNERVNIIQNSLFISSPKDSVSIVNYSDGFDGYIVLIPLAIIERHSAIRFHIWQLYDKLKRKALFTLKKEHVDILISYINLLEARTTQSCNLNSVEATGHIATSFILDAIAIIMRNTVAEEKMPLTSAGQLYGRFLSILNSCSVQKRPVSYFADKLCVTPKYLSSICKTICGKSASDIVTDMLLEESFALLRDFDKSVKTIAYDLGFSTQSAFGKYFKAKTGMSPIQFRAQQSTRFIAH